MASPPLAVQLAGLFLAHLAPPAAPAVVHRGVVFCFSWPFSLFAQKDELALIGLTTRPSPRPLPSLSLGRSFRSLCFLANSLSTLIALKIISLGGVPRFSWLAAAAAEAAEEELAAGGVYFCHRPWASVLVAFVAPSMSLCYLCCCMYMCMCMCMGECEPCCNPSSGGAAPKDSATALATAADDGRHVAVVVVGRVLPAWNGLN